jgi:NADH-quinone oxidoreductase subunit L
MVLLGFTFSGLSSAIALGSKGFGQEMNQAAPWFHVGHYQAVWQFTIDPLALTMATLTSILICTIAVFSRNYMHQEPGFFRFYLLMNLFGFGVLLVVLAGSLDQIFVGWELVGLTSALLIAFFAHRPGPAESGFRAFLTYRICDIGLLSAVVWLHHSVGSSSFVATGQGWMGLSAGASGQESVVVLLLLFACLGKSALFPFGGWLPRAMEGPTPSSAVFYGALSVNLGPYLLLRARPLIEDSFWATFAVVAVGLLTAIHGSMVGRVQTDVKGALAYGSMTQIGLIVAEIGLGFETLALIHMVGHACMRTLEILRAPSVLHEYHNLELSLGSVLPRMGQHYELLLPPSVRHRLYRIAIGRGALEPVLLRFVSLWCSLFLRVDKAEQGIEDFFSRGSTREQEGSYPSLEVIK